jgi:hypothetical protein
VSADFPTRSEKYATPIDVHVVKKFLFQLTPLYLQLLIKYITTQSLNLLTYYIILCTILGPLHVSILEHYIYILYIVYNIINIVTTHRGRPGEHVAHTALKTIQILFTYNIRIAYRLLNFFLLENL